MAAFVLDCYPYPATEFVKTVHISYEKFRAMPTQETNGGKSILGKAHVYPLAG